MEVPVIEDVQLLVTQIVADLVKVNVVLRVRQAAPIAGMLVLIVVLYAEMLVEMAVDMVAVHHVLLDAGMDVKVLAETVVVKDVVFVKEVVAVDVGPVGDNVLMDVATDVIVLVVILVIKDAQKLVNLIVLILVKVNARDTVKGVVQMAAQKDAQLPLAFLQ